MKNWILCTLLLFGLWRTASAADWAPPRMPPVVFDSGPLQSYLDVADPGIDVVADQLALFGWFPASSETPEVVVTLQSRSDPSHTVGIYHYDPVVYELFPAEAAPGWYAVLSFSGMPPGLNLDISVFDQNHVLQSQTYYGGLWMTVFGLYTRGLCGSWYTDDHVNHPASPQALTYASPSVPGTYWVCFESCAYDQASSTFTGAIVSLASASPTPATRATWGQVKSQYH